MLVFYDVIYTAMTKYGKCCSRQGQITNLCKNILTTRVKNKSLYFHLKYIKIIYQFKKNSMSY